MKRYCTVCGKEMNKLEPRTEISYDRMTGKEIKTRIERWKCPDYDSGYSDREWHVHDYYEEKIK